jgi:hypothetical protein
MGVGQAAGMVLVACELVSLRSAGLDSTDKLDWFNIIHLL